MVPVSIFSLFISIYLACLFFSCSFLKNNSAKELSEDKYQKIAEEKYKHDIIYTFNQSKSYVLCKKFVKPSPKMHQSSVSFFVYDLEKDKIVYEKSVDNGKVKWANDSKLKISIIPGIISGDEDMRNYNYLYDIKKQKKIIIQE